MRSVYIKTGTVIHLLHLPESITAHRAGVEAALAPCSPPGAVTRTEKEMAHSQNTNFLWPQLSSLLPSVSLSSFCQLIPCNRPNCQLLVCSRTQVELHVHLDGSIRVQTILDVAR